MLMMTHGKTVLALTMGIMFATIAFDVARSQTKPAYWVTEVLEMQNQEAFMKAIQAVPTTVQKFGGRYIVLGGKIAADVGPEPKRIAIISFDSMERAQQWLADPTAKGLRDEVNKHAKVRSYTVEGGTAGPLTSARARIFPKDRLFVRSMQTTRSNRSPRPMPIGGSA
jgi:uncharacterized protein (DUF1330 family)